MEQVTVPQLRCINALVAKLRLTEHKASLVLGFSYGRTESTKELTKAEGIEFIKHLKSQDPDELKAEVMRRKIISRFHEMRYHKPGTLKIDMVRVDGWCQQYGYLHKHLNQYSLAELPALVTQADAAYQSFLNGR